MNNAAAIETVGLSKTYLSGELIVPVLDGIDLTVEAGEFAAVTGPSGSGKSTLLYLLGGLDRPTEGFVRLMGSELSNMDDREISRLRRRRLGFVFQFYNLVPNLNVEENILLPLLLDGKRKQDVGRRLKEILEEVNLGERRRHTPRELSGGQQQRVAIARALIGNPDVILADEPTGNLDSRSGAEVMTLLRRVCDAYGKTVVMVTHSADAAAYADRRIHVRDGKIWERE